MKIKHIALSLLALVLLLSSMPAKAESQVRYKGIISTYYPNSMTSVYAAPDKDSQVITTLKPGTPIQVMQVDPGYVSILINGKTGWVLRHRIMDVEPLDPASTPRYGTAINHYFATMAGEVHVKAAPDKDSETLITLKAGAQLGFLDVTDGWARTIFKRQYGYVDTRSLPELEMVAPSPEAGTSEVPIAVYNSFYNIADNESNINRISNLAVGGERMSKTLAPGQSMDFNAEVGPFRASNGYKPAGALVDGELVLDVYGGGSCQVSSTLYNVLLQLNKVTVLRRAPHGPGGILYLPHGVDATSGRLNLVFRNDYEFPISIRTHVQDGSLFIAMYRDI